MKVKLVLAIVCLSCALMGQSSIPGFKFQKRSLFKLSKETPHKFGYLKVYENRSDPNSNIIELPIYIFKSRSANPKPDPLIVLTGGPGSSIMRNARWMKYWQYLDDRDLILFEQRGTTYAKPHLACPEWAIASTKAYELSLTSTHPEEHQAYIDSLFANAAISCRDLFKEKGIDLNGYHTDAIAQDVNEFVSLMGYDEYNLLTMSYGTKIAQVLMRDFPERIRSVVLDCPLPLEASYDEESNTNFIETLEILFQDCKEDVDCNNAFPDLKGRFFRFLKEANAQPISIQITHPVKKELVTVYLRGKDIASFFGGYSTGRSAEIPFMMNQILNGDFSLIKKELEELPNTSGTGRGMRLSVWCAEESPFVSRQKIEAEMNKYPAIKGLNPATVNPDICKIWGVKSLDEKANQAISSNIPTLILNGEYDEITPVRWGAMLHENLPKSFHLVFKGYKHGITTYWDNSCGMNIANAFFNDPLAKPDLDCFEEINTPKFRVK